jgi:tetratricopeptide (TPR) repeat protein
MSHRSTSTVLSVVGVALALAAPAWAQSTEFKLDPGGNWVQTKAPEPGSDEALVAQARRDLAEGRYAAARKATTDFIDSPGRANSPFLAEALLVRGDATTAEGDEFQALYDYERIIKEFPATPSFVTALERELDIGVRYVNGLKRRWLGVRVFDATEIGEELLIRVQERLPGSRLAERAGIELADYYYRERDLEMAGEAYDLFQQNYPQSQYYMKAAQRRVYSSIGRFKGPRYDGSVLIDARVLTQRFSELYPTEARQSGLDDALLVRLDESAADAQLETAKWYLAQEDEVSSRLVLRRLVQQHSRTAAAETAIKMLEERGWSLVAPRPLAPPEPEKPASAKSDAGKEPANGADKPAPGDAKPEPAAEPKEGTP